MLVSNLPNLFDQYSVEENRVTNALLQTVASSPTIVSSFLKEFISERHDARSDKIEIDTQKRPSRSGDRRTTSKLDREIRTVPDGRIICEKPSWGLVLESKIFPGTVREEQLLGHLRSITSYRRKHLLVLTPDRKEPQAIRELKRKRKQIHWHPWTRVHRWTVNLLKTKRGSDHSRRLLSNLRGYLEMKEHLSAFQGIDFREGYDRRRAKSCLISLMDELQPQVRKFYPALKERRDSITTDGTSVWDCFGVHPFTSDLHFTVSIEEARTVISLTLPNNARRRWRRLKEVLRDPSFRERFQQILSDTRKRAPEVWLIVVQRHFKGQRVVVPDATLEFNFDTANLRSSKRGTKTFPLWFKATEDAIQKKAGVNLQLQLQVRFIHKHFPKVKSPQFVNIAQQTIRNFKPLYQLLKS